MKCSEYFSLRLNYVNTMEEIVLLAEWPNGGYDGAYNLDTDSCDIASSQSICLGFRNY